MTRFVQVRPMLDTLVKTRQGYRCAVMFLVPTLVSSCAMGVQHSEIIEGAPIAYVSKADSGPTVVFEAGLGNQLTIWESVYNDVAEFANVMAYSRAGYAGNLFHIDKGGRRTADDVAGVLRQLLDKRDIPGPYVLVGHSIGGNYALRFAMLYPSDVAGLVLLDSRPKEFSRECRKAGLRPCGPSEIQAAVQPAHIAAEIRGIDETEEQTPIPSELGNLPITVIAATEPPPGGSRGLQPLWVRLQKQFAERLENGRYVQADGSGHFIQRDAPELVVREIRLLLNRLPHRLISRARGPSVNTNLATYLR